MRTRRALCVSFLLLLFILWPTALHSEVPPTPELEIDVSKIYGRIQFVEHFPDFKVQVVENFPDLRVQRVEHFPDAPGKWQIVEHFPDYKIQLVDHFPDFKIKYVDHFPGVE